MIECAMSDQTTAAPGRGLPFIDVHDVLLPLEPSKAWQRLQAAIGRSPLLGSRGFPQRDETAPWSLRLAGEHLFATYELHFVLDDLTPVGAGGVSGPPNTRVRALTYARFASGLGRVYRAVVIGSGVHAIIVGRFLRKLGRRQGP